MKYSFDFDGDLSNIVIAAKNCEAAALNISNKLLLEMCKNDKTMKNKEKYKQDITDLMRICMDWSSINTIQKIIEGTINKEN